MSITLNTTTLSITLLLKDGKVTSGTKTVEDIFREDDKVLARVNTRTNDLSIYELEKWDSFINHVAPPEEPKETETQEPEPEPEVEVEVVPPISEPEVPHATAETETALNKPTPDVIIPLPETADSPVLGEEEEVEEEDEEEVKLLPTPKRNKRAR